MGKISPGTTKLVTFGPKFSKNPARQYRSITAPPEPMKPDCVLRKVEDIDIVEQVILVGGTVTLEQTGVTLVILGVSL